MAHTGVQIEHPLITELYDGLVSNGNWSAVENVLQRAASMGLFDVYLRSTQPQAIWKRLYGINADGDAPSRRGGHAMCIDDRKGLIFLFGGWDGQKSLDDFWVYSSTEDRWSVLSRSAAQEKDGPSPRSCHKIAFDSNTGCIYLLGGLYDGDGGGGEPVVVSSDPPPTSESNLDMPSTSTRHAEFYRYHTEGPNEGQWELLSGDVAVCKPSFI